MSIETLAPWLLLAASFAAGLSGLLALAHSHDDIGGQKDVSTQNRRIARVLFVLGLSMLGWAAVWVLETRTWNPTGSINLDLHKFLVVGIATIVGIANYFRKRREQAQKRDGR